MKGPALVLLLAAPLVLEAMASRKKSTSPRPPAGRGGGPTGPAGGHPDGGSGIPGVAQPWPPPPPSPVPGGSWLASLAEEYSPHRETRILDAIAAGLGEFEWYNLESRGEGPYAGWTMAVPVMADALKIEGVRVTGTQPTAQALSDREGWVQLTPYVAGLIWEQAHAKLTPTTMSPVTAKTSQMIEASRQVEQKLAPIKGPRDVQGYSTLVGNPGKDWVLTRKWAEPGSHPDSGVPHKYAAANHGLFQSAWRPIQNVGVFHPLNHVDYSQTLRFMGPEIMLVSPEGAQSFHRTLDVLMDPELAPFLTGTENKIYGAQVGEGALAYNRHPALPPAGILA